MLNIIFFALLIVAVMHPQSATSGETPIILEWADSLVGTGAPGQGWREFVGNVRFRQGNVTVRCDRAIHYPEQNSVDLFGKVVVEQAGFRLRSLRGHYNGNTRIATAEGSVEVSDSSNTVRSRYGKYWVESRIAEFTDSVFATDDTVRIWSNSARYYRSSRRTESWGSVVVYDTVHRRAMSADSLIHDPKAGLFRLVGDAGVWLWEEGGLDTTIVVADLIERTNEPELLTATGSSSIVSGSVKARSEFMKQDSERGTIQLSGDPVVWVDSTQLLADTITVFAPDRILEEVVGVEKAILISRTDTVRPERFDQVSGNIVTIRVRSDTIREIVAVGDARSVTFRTEDERGEGVGVFRSDTIWALFSEGKPEDVYWIGGVQGEHHPEHLTALNIATFKLPGFEWREDRPIYQSLPVVWGERLQRTQPRKRQSGPNQQDFEKKE